MTPEADGGQGGAQDDEVQPLRLTGAAAPGSPPEARRRRWRRAAVALAALPLAPIVAGFVIPAASNGGAAPAAGRYRPVAAAPSPGPSSSGALPRGRGALVAVLTAPAVMRRAPGGPPLHRIGRRTPFGSPTALWVVALRPGWLGVVSQLAGNGHLGWIPRSNVQLARVDWELRVSLSARQLTVLHGGTAVKRYTVAIGRPSAPTPTGRFAVTDRLDTGDPTGPYGCCIVALSALSPHAIQGWVGGNRIAIHSTPDTSSIGQAVSHGCVRLTLTEGRWLLGRIPLGTPTLIGA
jgi:lipoprotein-anchoring transpeptidase ErfK/SrfK